MGPSQFEKVVDNFVHDGETYRFNDRRADKAELALEKERLGREEADKEIISLLHDVKSRYDAKIKSYMASKEATAKKSSEKSVEKGAEKGTEKSPEKGSSKDADKGTKKGAKKGQNANQNAHKKDDSKKSEAAAQKQTQNAKKASKPSQDDGWGEPSSQADKPNQDDDGWGTTTEPAGNQDDGWGTTTEPAGNQDDGWGTTTEPAGNQDDGWGTTTAAPADNQGDGGWGTTTANNQGESGWGTADNQVQDDGWGSTGVTPVNNQGEDDWGATTAAPADDQGGSGWGATTTSTANKQGGSGWGTTTTSTSNKQGSSGWGTTTAATANKQGSSGESKTKASQATTTKQDDWVQQIDYLQNQLSISREESNKLKKRNLRLEKDLNHSKTLIKTLREGCSMVEDQAKTFESRHDTIMMSKAELERELIAIKEESSRHITTINKLQKSNEQISKAFIVSVEAHEACKKELDVLQQKYKRKLESFQIENLRLTEANNQLRKLIEYMQK